jgi:hypothetical protein
MTPKWVAEQRGPRICAIVTTLHKSRSKPMDTYTEVPQRVFVELSEELLATASPIDVQNDADVARSERNVLQWMAYLPEDCVRTMIQMRWDVTT